MLLKKTLSVRQFGFFPIAVPCNFLVFPNDLRSTDLGPLLWPEGLCSWWGHRGGSMIFGGGPVEFWPQGGLSRKCAQNSFFFLKLPEKMHDLKKNLGGNGRPFPGPPRSRRPLFCLWKTWVLQEARMISQAKFVQSCGDSLNTVQVWCQTDMQKWSVFLCSYLVVCVGLSLFCGAVVFTAFHGSEKEVWRMFGNRNFFWKHLEELEFHFLISVILSSSRNFIIERKWQDTTSGSRFIRILLYI